MKKNTDLKNYLHLWKEHFSSDVEGQSAQTQHLDEEKLREMVEAGGINNADPADIEHLSTCPICLEEWSRLCAQTSEGETQDRRAPLPISYGTIEDDVTGQSESMTLRSSCETFTLTISPDPDDSNHAIITLKVTDPELEQAVLQIRDRNGMVMAEGKVEKGELITGGSLLSAYDLTIWTVLKKSST